MSWSRLSERTSNTRPDRVSSTHSPNLLSMGQATVEADQALAGFTLWSAGAYSTEQASQGAGSLKITASYAGEYIGFAVNAVAVTPAVHYSARCAVLAGTVARSISLGITWMDESMANIGGASWSFDDDPTDWTVITNTQLAPANAAYLSVELLADEPLPEGESHYFDEFAVYQGYEYEWYPPA